MLLQLHLIHIPLRHGAQGVLDGASKGTLQSEFGTTNEDECITKILEKGEYQVTPVCSLSIIMEFIHMFQVVDRILTTVNRAKNTRVIPTSATVLL